MNLDLTMPNALSQPQQSGLQVNDIDDEGIPAEAMAAIHRMTSNLSSGFHCIVCPMIFRQLFSLVQHQQRHFVEDKLIEKSKAHGDEAPKTVFLEEIKG